MQNTAHIVLGIIMAFLLGCGSSTSTTPTITTANEPSHPSYLPFALGNKWTFSDNSYLIDQGPITGAQFCCNGKGFYTLSPNPEDIAYFSSTGVYQFDFVFSKASIPAGVTGIAAGQPALWLVGMSATPVIAGIPPVMVGTASPYTAPGLILILNETPQIGQFFYDNLVAASSSTIIAANGVQPYGNEQITQVAQISISAPYLSISQPTLTPYASGTYSLAFGVGFTRMPGTTGNILTLKSFLLN